MTSKEPAVSNIVICPSCGAENIEGADVCEQCQMDMVNIDALETVDDPLGTPLSSLRLSKPLIVQRTAPVREAVELLTHYPDSAVLVLDGSDLVGIFTERDVLKRVAGRGGALESAIAEYMTTDPVVLRENDNIAVALNKMGTGGFRHIPLMQDGHVVATVTVRDVMVWMMTSYFD